LKLKQATWKLHTEALRRYHERHKGSLDQAEQEMDNLLKPRIGHPSKSPINKCVSADRDFDNRQSVIIDNPPPYPLQAAETDKCDRSSKHQLIIVGAREHHTGMPAKISGNKVLMNSGKTSCVSQHDMPSTDPFIAHSSVIDAENYDEDESVFDDELIFDDGCLDYETSSVSVDIVSDHVMSEDSLADDKPEKASSYYCDDAQAADSGKLTLKLNDVGGSMNSDDESILAVNAVKLVTGAQRHESKKDTLKIDIHLPAVPNNSACTSCELTKYSSDKNSNNRGGVISIDKHISEVTENVRQVLLDKVEATKTGCLAADEYLHLNQMNRQPSSCSRQLSSQNIIRDNNDFSSVLYINAVEDTEKVCPFLSDEPEAVTADGRPKQHQKIVVEHKTSSSLCKEAALQSGVLSRHDSLSVGGLSVASCDDSDWNLASLFENTADNSGTATSVATGRTSESSIVSETNLDCCVGYNLFSESIRSSGNSEGKSSGKHRSPESCSFSAVSPSSKCNPRSGNYQGSTVKNGEEMKLVVVPSPFEYLSSSHSNSDWHLASIFDEQWADGNESNDGESTAWNWSSRQCSGKRRSSVSSSEWHIGSLLFDSSRQSSGDCMH